MPTNIWNNIYANEYMLIHIAGDLAEISADTNQGIRQWADLALQILA